MAKLILEIDDEVLAEALAGVVAGALPSVDEVEEDEPAPKKKAPTKKKAPAKKKVVEEEEEDEEEDETEDDSDDDTDGDATADEVKQLFQEFKKECGADDAKELLEEFDLGSVRGISKLGQDELNEMFDILNDSLDGE